MQMSQYVSARLAENFDDPLVFDPSHFDHDKKRLVTGKQILV